MQAMCKCRTVSFSFSKILGSVIVVHSPEYAYFASSCIKSCIT
uniref:Uncharacterized protein n=1 Tax=Arundo donax TaxID=35708 RepID=A0A0A8YYA3_ARUDO